MAEAKTNVENLTEWFEGLPASEQKKVLEFLYGKAYVTVQLQEGVYCGPAPGVVKQFSWEKKGLYLGPAPTQNVSVCPTCKRPL